jgi:phosphoglycerol transferase MdoB-like AlkP superfamily enzyme
MALLTSRVAADGGPGTRVFSLNPMPALLLRLRETFGRAFDRLFPGRFAIVGIVVIVYLAVSLLTRIGLAFFNGEVAEFVPWRLAGWLFVGLAYDLAAATFWLLPSAMLVWLWPAGRARRTFGVTAIFLASIAFGVFVFTAVSEFVFWNEFSSRFNFIAVDYLIYTREVIGNIRESYPMTPIYAGLALLTLVIVALTARPLWCASQVLVPRIGRRSLFMAGYVIVAVASFLLVPPTWKEFSSDVQAQQLAGNGHWEFFHAFNTNEIDYDRFYATVPIEKAYQEVRSEFTEAGPVEFTGDAGLPIERVIRAKGPEKPLNVVLISVESLSADYLGAFGNTRGLTPNLDRLATEGMLFTKLYATGTRTVRGLEALALSLPPTPGHSVIKRPNNENLFTVGEVFAEKGYEPIFIYGGYGYFDNMEHFFAGNGYTFVDRNAVDSGDIHYENIWGVADEDLFTLALRELDRRYADGRKFFAHVMTTSNHRPYTYPAGRIDLAPGSGADGAVKYTDWAIGSFIERARQRPWFDDTVFVIVADHCAAARGRTDLPLDRFHIPLIIYAPKQLVPARIETIASQIDVAPTVLALLNMNYVSRFFGQDILAEGRTHQRALMANYQTVGYYERDMLVELRPQRRVSVVDPETGREMPASEETRHFTEEAIGYYQGASNALRTGALRMPGHLLPRPAE